MSSTDTSELFADLEFWLIADTHFCHANIAEYAGRPDGHQDFIIENWRGLVSDADTILHLGDLALGQKSAYDQEVGSLPGNKFIIKGNHDRNRPTYWFEERGFKVISSFEVAWEGKQIFFSHEPQRDCLQADINVHGHIHQKVVGDPRFVNVSVERVGYRPVRARDVMGSALALKT